MLKKAEELQHQAEVLSLTAKSIGADADVAVASLKEFREWAAKTVAVSSEVHEAVKAKLDEDHAKLVEDLGVMTDKLSGIIAKLEGATNG